MSTNSNLKKHIQRIENPDTTIKEHNGEKSNIYKRAKGEGYDVKVIKRVIQIGNGGIHEEEEALIATYMAQL